ncbi:MAG: hypothetical protein AB7E32_04115 [Desulfovibrio sp.]
MYKTLTFMIMALVVTVFAALISNDFNTRAMLVADAGRTVTAAVDVAPDEGDSLHSGEPQTDADGNITLPQERAAALLFMGVLRDN